MPTNNNELGDQATQQLLNCDSNARFDTLVGFQDGDYGTRECRLAFAMVDAGVGGGGGGGGGTPPADIATGIDASTDIDTIISLLQAIDVNTDEIEVKLDAGNITISNVEVNTQDIENALGTATDPAIDANTDGTISSRLRGIQEELAGDNATAIVDAAGVANGTSQVISPANASTLELYIQNKATAASGDLLFIRNNGAASPTLSITLNPGGSHVFTGFEAQQALQAITAGGNVDYYVKRTNG